MLFIQNDSLPPSGGDSVYKEESEPDSNWGEGGRSDVTLSINIVNLSDFLNSEILN